MGRRKIKLKTAENPMTALHEHDAGPVSSARYRGDAASLIAPVEDDVSARPVHVESSPKDRQTCTSTVTRSVSSGMFASIENLRQIMARCVDGKPLDPHHATWLLEEALGLRFPRGGIPWWREEATRKRNAALRYLAGTFLHDLAPGNKVQVIWTAARRYSATAWRFDRKKDEMPPHYSATLKECLWHAFKSGARMPIGKRQLRNILDR
jgi:hypothetical protein